MKPKHVGAWLMVIKTGQPELRVKGRNSFLLLSYKVNIWRPTVEKEWRIHDGYKSDGFGLSEES